nr:hypothetical protein [Tanacetum cinerariifolium]
MMATNDKDSSAAGTDNHPPMLEERDFKSWKIRIERYIHGKPFGKLIWKSIKNRPTPHLLITVSTGEGEQQTQVTREKTNEEFTEAENNKERDDIQATNILSQGLLRNIFNTLNQTETPKEIWENVELLMQGSGPHAAVAFMANLKQTGLSTREGINNDTDFHAAVQTYDNHFFNNLNHQVSQEMHQGEQLDSYVDSVIDDHDNTILYHQYQLNNEVKSVPTDVSSVLPGGIFMITILDDLRLQLAGYIKVNEEQSFANDSLKAELERFKTQVQNLEQSKHKSLKTECEKLKNDKNALEESYLEELVCLRNTNKVVMELLQSYGQPVQTVPMLSKRPTFSSKDLHKYALGYRNLLYLKRSQLCIPGLYHDDIIVDPVHTPFRVYDSEETLVQAEVSRTKMLERMKDPLCKVSSKPVNYDKLNSLYDTFVPQKQLSREQVYWLPANEVASYNSNQSKPVTNFIRTRLAKSQVNTHLKLLKACFPEFDKSKFFNTSTAVSTLTSSINLEPAAVILNQQH